MSDELPPGTERSARELELFGVIEEQKREVIGEQARVMAAAMKLGRLSTALVISSIVAATTAGATAIPDKGAWHWVAVVAGFLQRFSQDSRRHLICPKQKPSLRARGPARARGTCRTAQSRVIIPNPARGSPVRRVSFL